MQSQIRCRKPTQSCIGVIGAWSDGSFFPAAHLRPSRDLWLGTDGKLRVRCPMCNTWHLVTRDAAGRLLVRISDEYPP